MEWRTVPATLVASMPSFVSEIASRVLAGQAPIVIGLDPRLDALPDQVAPGAPPAERIVQFYRKAMPVIARHAPCVKPNIAFFECYGSAGYAAFEETCELARAAGLLVLADVKRGDIGSTAEAYAQAHYAVADAVTLHPYLGADSVAPFLGACQPELGGKAVFVLVRTSNPGARDFQDLQVAGEGGPRALCDVVAQAVTRWGAELPRSEGYSPVGAVVGATWPEELRRLRALMPHSWLLLPGVGAQGASVQDLAAAFDRRGLGALVNQSRGVMQAFKPGDAGWLERIEAAAAAFARDCRAVATAGGAR